MSGPKVSEYELEQMERERQARRLEEERRRREEEERRKREEQRKQSLFEIGRLRDSLKGHQNNLRQLEKEALYMASYREMDGTLQRISDDLDNIADILGPFTSDTLEQARSYEEKLRSIDKKLVQEFDYFEDEKRGWDEALDGALDKALSELFTQEIDESYEAANPSEDILVSDDAKKQRERVLLIQREEDKKIAEGAVKDILLKADAYNDDEDFSKELRRQAKVIENLVSLGDFHGATSFFYQNEKELDKLEKVYHESKLERLKNYEDALLSYETVCEIAGVTPKAAPENISLADTIEWLTRERIDTEAEYLALLERQKINSALSEVMEELGYHVIAEKETIKKSGRQVHEEVFSFGEGTAVNITESQGQITMEIVGIDTSTRMPDETEEEYLEEEMETFCTAHKEIEEKLRTRGIVLKQRIQLNKPSKEYARILNITGYDQKTSNISMIQDRHSDRKRQASASESLKNN